MKKKVKEAIDIAGGMLIIAIIVLAILCFICYIN
jgi:hypothetical protein